MKLLPTLFGLFLTLLVVAGCDQKHKKKEAEMHVEKSLLHPYFFQDEIAQVLNFPFWFNDSIVRAQKIKTISWISYGSLLDTDTENDRIEELPKRTVIYTFNTNGQLIAVQQTDFSEGIIISSQMLAIKPGKNSAYSSVSKGTDLFGVENNAYIIVRAAIRKNVAQYDNEQTDERLHYISNSKYFSPLSVDSIAHPEETDWVILGTPSRPTKRYKVKNKVREKQVTTYSYWNDNFPKSTTNDEFPFTKKRTFTYSNNGLFIGYIDSTFIDDAFVTSVTTKIAYEKGLPTRVEHLKTHSENQKVFKKKEQFKYETYE